MNTELTTTTEVNHWKPEQIELIKTTVAKNATDSEFKLFLYRCRILNLDPLKPGQVHFIKYGTSPGTIVIGIEGFRAQAGRSGKLCGIKRGVVRNDKGQCIGAWAEVYRSDWTHPAREEVSLVEYNTGKNLWAKMPETMIKKVAEASALRMAFPDELGGIYSEEEMDQAKHPVELNVSSEPPVIPQVIPQVIPPVIPQVMEEPLGRQLHKLKELMKVYSWSDQAIRDLLKTKFGGRKFSDLSVEEREQVIEEVKNSWQNEDVS